VVLEGLDFLGIGGLPLEENRKFLTCTFDFGVLKVYKNKCEKYFVNQKG
jgi:hypothetical protein